MPVAKDAVLPLEVWNAAQLESLCGPEPPCERRWGPSSAVQERDAKEMQPVEVDTNERRLVFRHFSCLDWRERNIYHRHVEVTQVEGREQASRADSDVLPSNGAIQ